MGWSVMHGTTTCGSRNHTLGVNEACLNVISNFGTPLMFYTRNTECFKCDYTKHERMVVPQVNSSFVIDTNYGLEWYFNSGEKQYCPMRNHFEDFGVYQLNISENDCGSIEVVQRPENFWISMGLLLVFYLGILITFWLLRFMYKHYQLYMSSSNVSLRELEMDLGNPRRNREERRLWLRRQTRVFSIDAFRGLAILLMIFVNYGGGEYSLFKHTPWNGLGVADLVFPWFVWIMGASLVLSFRSNLRTSSSKRKIFGQILKRSLLLICLGLMLNSGKRYNHFLRLSGVLQRLGVTYFVVAVSEIFIAKSQRNNQFGPWFYCQDIMDSWMQWILAISCAIAHTLLTFLLEVPGCPTGYLGPGGFSDHSSHVNCTGGAAGYVDRLVLTDNHMYHHGTFVKIFKPPVAYDPEGILGTLTSIFCAFLGVHAGRVILSFDNPSARIRRWLLWALLTGISAGFLCGWSQNEGIIPVNKNLWSLSYVLACSSLAYLILAIFHGLIDSFHIWSGNPLIYPGMNAITLYLGHSLLKEQLPWRWSPFTNTHLELLLMDITAMIIWLNVSWVLYKKNIFISL